MNATHRDIEALRRRRSLPVTSASRCVVVCAICAFVTVRDTFTQIDVAELSVAKAQRRMTAGRLTARALTRAYLDRIAALDDAGPQLRAVIDINAAALAEASARDAERKAR